MGRQHAQPRGPARYQAQLQALAVLAVQAVLVGGALQAALMRQCGARTGVDTGRWDGEGGLGTCRLAGRHVRGMHQAASAVCLQPEGSTQRPSPPAPFLQRLAPHLERPGGGGPRQQPRRQQAHQAVVLGVGGQGGAAQQETGGLAGLEEQRDGQGCREGKAGRGAGSERYTAAVHRTGK